MDIKGVRYDAATDTIEEFEYVGADKNELLKEYEKNQKQKKADKAEAQAKATAKAALLERLGISEDEARLLLA